MSTVTLGDGVEVPDRKPKQARRSRAERLQVVQRVEDLAASQGGVLSRDQAAELGVDKNRVAQEIRSGRWVARGRHTVAIHRGPLAPEAVWRTTLIEVGAGAVLDGATALLATGLERFEAGIHVSVQHGRRPSRPDGVTVHEVIGWHEADVMDVDVPRVRPAVAAVRAAGWAASDRQAALVLLMTVQQRLALPERMLAHAQSQLKLRRRTLIEGVLAEAVDGVQALGELDFARLCRQRGLPEPTRQVVRQRPSGRAYLDVGWEQFGVAVEIDGIHHLDPENFHGGPASPERPHAVAGLRLDAPCHVLGASSQTRSVPRPGRTAARCSGSATSAPSSAGGLLLSFG